MGCVSSKMITKSASFRDDWHRWSFRRKGDGLDEVILSKNGGEQLVALLSVARRIKEGSPPAHEPAHGKNKEEDSIINSLGHTSSEETSNKNQNDMEGRQGSSSTEVSMVSSDSRSPSRRFRTIEDLDAMLAAKQSRSAEEAAETKTSTDRGGGGDEIRPAGSRRRAMGKELAALSVPSAGASTCFEFSRAGGSRPLLPSSPGSYVTPKFGDFDATQRRAKVDVAVFDPELIAHFERAMEELTMEEDCILEKIIEGVPELQERAT